MVRTSIRAAAAAAWLSAGAAAAGAQGSAADYERAGRLAEEVRGLVLNERPEWTWLSPTTLVFRRQSSTDDFEFVRVDTDRGRVEPAFDHAVVAAELGRLLGHAVDAGRLPVAALAVAGRLVLLVEGVDRALRVDFDPPAVTEVIVDESVLPALGTTLGRRSSDRGGDAWITFVNRLDLPIALEWIDQRGAARDYGRVPAGERRRQPTHAGHLWRVTDAAGIELGRYRAERGHRAVVVDPEQPPPSQAPPARRRRGASRDGRWQAFVRDHDLWLRELATGAETVLDAGGSDADRYVERFEWSADAGRLLAVQEVPAEDHPLHMVEAAPRDRLQPRLHTLQYLKPGDRIARPRPRLFDVAGRCRIPIDEAAFANPWSIDRLEWQESGSEFTFLYNERGHQLLRVLAVAADGAVRTVVEERSPTFVDYSNKTHLQWLDGGRRLLWMSERSGWNHLYRIDAASGEVINAVTAGSWVVRAVDRVDEASQQIWFRAMGVYPDQDPYHVHHGRVGLDGAGLTWLTVGDGTHEIVRSPDGAHYVDTFSRADLPPVHELRRSADGTLVVELARADAAPLLATGWRLPERFVVKGRDGATDVWGLLLYPSTFDPHLTYPVVESIYAGPHGQHVPKAFRAWLGARAVAELGFVVGLVDGMGTNWRSKAFHDVCWRNLADAGFPDRIAWWQAAAAARPFLDLTRVGIFGGSAGGQNALRALLAHGDFYSVAVADCGCHDNRMDKIWWNEAWMGWPVGDHYRQQSNVTHAHRLQGELLLIVGELDRNVDPASTMQVVDALVRADKDFELVVLPGVGHGAAGTPYGRRRQADFLVRKLLRREPRWR